MQTYPKKRIEIIIEAPLLRRVTDCFEKAKVPGYSILPVIAGGGQTGSWSAEGQITEASSMVAAICIVDAAKVDTLLNAIYAIVSQQIGFVTVSDVAVVRAERF